MPAAPSGLEVSVFTAAHRRADDLARPLRSLQSQTLSSWEWVVVDDSPDDRTEEALDRLTRSSGTQGKVRVLRQAGSGCIGRSKAAAAAACRGPVLVELDHDDELLPDALELILRAFDRFPDVDFVYSDWIDRWSDGQLVEDVVLYPPEWAFGFGGHAYEIVQGAPVPVALAPAITFETVRHIVSMPNHVRAWRAETYRSLGGHDPSLVAGDDYELLVRTFLGCRMGRIPRPLYVQHHEADGRSASRRMNDEVQRVVADVAAARAAELDARCAQLGIGRHGNHPLTDEDVLRSASRILDPAAMEAQDAGRPLVSVIVVVGEADDPVTAVQPALAQRYAPMEILVVGEACEDAIDLLDEIDDPRVRCWNLADVPPSAGSSAVRYAERVMARGTVVARMTDEWTADHVAHLVSELESRR